MQLNDALIDHLSKLACLEFSDSEKENIRKDLERMISFVEKLGELDVTGVEPLLHMSPQVNVFREDELTESTRREEALKNAPATDNIYFKVPKVIKSPSK